MLRTHLGNLSKAGLGPAPITDKRLRGWDGWSDESVEMHLTTRFKQLEVLLHRLCTFTAQER
jgi:translation initiation factor 3 subunit A